MLNEKYRIRSYTKDNGAPVMICGTFSTRVPLLYKRKRTMTQTGVKNKYDLVGFFLKITGLDFDYFEDCTLTVSKSHIEPDEDCGFEINEASMLGKRNREYEVPDLKKYNNKMTEELGISPSKLLKMWNAVTMKEFYNPHRKDLYKYCWFKRSLLDHWVRFYFKYFDDISILKQEGKEYFIPNLIKQGMIPLPETEEYLKACSTSRLNRLSDVFDLSSSRLFPFWYDVPSGLLQSDFKYYISNAYSCWRFGFKVKDITQNIILLCDSDFKDHPSPIPDWFKHVFKGSFIDPFKPTEEEAVMFCLEKGVDFFEFNEVFTCNMRDKIYTHFVEHKKWRETRSINNYIEEF